MIYDVTLPKSQIPVFPDKCVVCGAKSPQNTTRITTHTISWWTFLTWWFGQRFTVRVPACPTCAISLHTRRWGSFLAFLLLIGLFVFILMPIITPIVPAALRKWTVMIVTIICISPFFLLEYWFPPAFDITARSKLVDYEFRDEDYFLEFAALNSVLFNFEFDEDEEEDEDDEEYDEEYEEEYEDDNDFDGEREQRE